ncbi:MAG: elongation factor G [Deltaproteobacteria bacterium]|nr:elongation factor G [Deltaproteobacteria bacterium]
MPRDIPLERLRNIGIMAHIDAGKTTCAERMLVLAGVLHRAGEVHHGDTALDYRPDERRRGITIGAAATHFLWTPTVGPREAQRHRVNLVDTPGHVDFTVEVERSLRVLDGAVCVLDAARGVEPQTETVWRQANRHRVPRVVFVNKVDKPGADFARCLVSLRERLGARPVAVQWPWVEHGEVRGVVDLLRAEALVWDDAAGRSYHREAVPEALRGAVTAAREALLEACAELDPGLTDRYLAQGGGALSPEELTLALRRATLAGSVVPVLCGSALKNRGVHPLLDAVCDWLPSPLDLPPVEGRDPKDDTAARRPAEDDAPVCALAFKVTHRRGAGAHVYVRVYAGTLRTGKEVLDMTRGKTLRVGRILEVHADDYREVSEAPTGAIVALLGMKNVRTGTTLCDPKRPLLLEAIDLPRPVVELALEPCTHEDEARLQAGLACMTLEDPSLQVGVDPETASTVLRGMGELHLEVVVERLREDHHAHVRTGAPKVAWRETLRGPGEVSYRHIKQEGGSGQFACVTLRAAPSARGEGFVFTDRTRGGVIPREFVPAVERGVAAALERGAKGHPMVDVSVELLDGEAHSQDSSAVAFEAAGFFAFRELCERCGCRTLEPIMAVEAVTPEPYLGEVLGSLQARRGTIRDVTASDTDRVVQADVPLARLFGYVTDLRGRTQGRASASLRFSHYAACD